MSTDSSNPPSLRMLELLRHGYFEILGPAPHRRAIEARLGPPDCYTAGLPQASIWKYGGLEFGFGAGDRTSYIGFSDFLAPNSFVDTWVLSERPDIEAMAEHLEEAGIAFERTIHAAPPV